MNHIVAIKQKLQEYRSKATSAFGQSLGSSEEHKKQAQRGRSYSRMADACSRYLRDVCGIKGIVS